MSCNKQETFCGFCIRCEWRIAPSAQGVHLNLQRITVNGHCLQFSTALGNLDIQPIELIGNLVREGHKEKRTDAD